MRPVRGARQRDEAVLDRPADQHLGRRAADAAARPTSTGWPSRHPRASGANASITIPSSRHSRTVSPGAVDERVHLDLVDGRRDGRVTEQLVQMADEEVRDADRAPEPSQGRLEPRRACVTPWSAFQSFVVTHTDPGPSPLARSASPTAASLP
jgi:hypothetical protein